MGDNPNSNSPNLNMGTLPMSANTSQPSDARLQQSGQFWNIQAPNFDQEPDHGLRDPLVRAAWARLLADHLPSPPQDILDIGCGTGSLGLLLAGQGHAVTGIDLSPAMLALAREKAAAIGLAVDFQEMDAALPLFPTRRFDALLCRHLLWALPEPAQVLQRWAGLLRPRGRLLLIEGFWHTGAGLHAGDLAALFSPLLAQVAIIPLSDQPSLWGRPVDDERYLLIARLVR